MGIPLHSESFAVATAASSGFFQTIGLVSLGEGVDHLEGGRALPAGHFADAGVPQERVDRLGGVGVILAELDLARRPRDRRFKPHPEVTLKNCSVLDVAPFGAPPTMDRKGPVQVFVLPIEDANGAVVDAVAWSPARPDLWHRRNGLGSLLGRDSLREARQSGRTLDLHATPKDWLLGGLFGCCLLDLEEASELRGVRAIRCRAGEWYVRLLSNAITRAGLRIPIYSAKVPGGFGLASEPRSEDSACWSRAEVLGEFRNSTRRYGR